MISLRNSSIFDSVNLESLNAFLSTINEFREPSVDRVDKRYAEKRSNGNSVLSFLISIGLVSIAKSDKRLVYRTFLPEETIINPDVLVRHFKTRIYNFPELLEYLSLFSPDKKGAIHFTGSIYQNVKFASIRNFLISSKIINFDPKTDFYELNTNYTELTELQIIKHHSISKAALQKDLAQKKLIGDLAEKAVFKYERKRLEDSPKIVSQVEHISEKNEGAGYDIRSFLLNDQNIFIPIRIEVKAVPAKSFRFFWSDNEINQSMEDSDSYYLYLLPVSDKNKLDVSSMLIIKNPYENVFKMNSNWTKRPHSYIIERIAKD